MSDTIHYIIVRRDLPFGVTLAQVAHAAAESSDGGNHTTVSILGVRDEQILLRLANKLGRKGLDISCICEPDAPYFNQLMAIGVKPGNRLMLARHFRKLQTYNVLNKPNVVRPDEWPQESTEDVCC